MLQGEATDTRAAEQNSRQYCRIHTAYTKREAIPNETKLKQGKKLVLWGQY